MTDHARRDEWLSTDMREQVLDDHRRIRDATRHMETARDLADLFGHLREFRALLESHFMSEEAAGGLYDNMRALGAEDPGKIEQLRQEHGELLGEIDGLSRRVQACLDGPVAEVLRKAGELARRLRHHETRENALLMDAAYTDLGHSE